MTQNKTISYGRRFDGTLIIDQHRKICFVNMSLFIVAIARHQGRKALHGWYNEID